MLVYWVSIVAGVLGVSLVAGVLGVPLVTGEQGFYLVAAAKLDVYLLVYWVSL